MHFPGSLTPTDLIRRPANSILQTRDAMKSSGAVAAELADCHARIESIDKELAAFTAISDPLEVLPDPASPLGGICVAVKDLYDTAGMVTSYGSPIYKSHVPQTDAALVARLRELGAHIAGKTVTTEFAWRQPGPTVNPWNPAHTPGGSSSGSAAAVAAGLVPLATGTQTFGSIIRPAAFCGVIGFKPSHGVLPLEGVQPLSPTLDHAGLFTRTVEDMSYVFQLLAGHSVAEDHTTQPSRVRLIRSPFWSQASPAGRAAVEHAADRLRHLGSTIVEQELPPPFDEALNVARTILAAEAASIYAPLIAQHPDLVSEHIRELVLKGQSLSPADKRDALAAREKMRNLFADEMKGYDAILTLPALGESPPLAQGTGDPALCVVWTLLGAPAITLPHGSGTDNLPVGIQLVAPVGRDHSLLSLSGRYTVD